MKDTLRRSLPILLLVMFALAARVEAASDIAVEFFAESGQISGATAVHGIEGAVPGAAMVHAWSVPLHGGTGQLAGSARAEHLSVTIPIGEPSTLLHDVHSTDGLLERVVFHFFRPSRDGRNEVFFRITVENAAIASIRSVHPDTTNPDNAQVEPYEVVELVYDSVELESEVRVERVRFVRGDLNDDLQLDVSDGIRLLLHLFRGLRISCPAAADVNDDVQVDVTDAIHVLNYLFKNGPPIPLPFPNCGEAAPGLSCEAAACGA